MNAWDCMQSGCEICIAYVAHCMAIPLRMPFSNAEVLLRARMSSEEVQLMVREEQDKQRIRYFKSNREHLESVGITEEMANGEKHEIIE